MKHLRKLSFPYLVWMMTLVFGPTILILLLSISDLDIYNLGTFTITFDSFSFLGSTKVINASLNSLFYSLTATFISFLIGYPVAFFLARSHSKYKTFFVSLLIIPVWSNMLLRIIAWEKLFYPISILNMFGISLDLIGTPLAIVIGMVSMYLPFMVLPIYSVLEKLDQNLIDAASDLGAGPYETFTKVIFPLSLSGVVSGTIMTLLPSMTAFALPERLGAGKVQLIGNVIQDYFMKTNQVNAGSLISIILMIFIVIMFILVLHFDKEGETLI
ncbi:ABC transporter permease [Candidatus Xianfuyuplasma coldseepsis]|uniref:ABC transporter permease n=1 Tax=Candidatus Xianfuyuplasma coldseepsis TaxID=2782163 RepID=A0A7L7KTP3_9MOLU|nr:ABC transporter permease [Xianfuyuplasma coldseepsis]QMS85682.1 ABC transporter permease [Xianfuyuplasma coldseepsis]